jgi:hypothetical protein
MGFWTFGSGVNDVKIIIKNYACRYELVLGSANKILPKFDGW